MSRVDVSLLDSGDEDWVQYTLRELELAGYRKGGARTAVVQLLGRQHCALTARDIDHQLREQGRAVGRASVYRVLEQLDELRLVQRIEVGQGYARYEPIHPSGEHHHHLVCDRCGDVTPFEDGDLERAIGAISDRVRFAVRDHDVVLHGTCGECRD